MQVIPTLIEERPLKTQLICTNVQEKENKGVVANEAHSVDQSEL